MLTATGPEKDPSQGLVGPEADQDLGHLLKSAMLGRILSNSFKNFQLTFFVLIVVYPIKYVLATLILQCYLPYVGVYTYFRPHFIFLIFFTNLYVDLTSFSILHLLVTNGGGGRGHIT